MLIHDEQVVPSNAPLPHDDEPEVVLSDDVHPCEITLVDGSLKLEGNRFRIVDVGYTGEIGIDGFGFGSDEEGRGWGGEDGRWLEEESLS